MIVFPAIDIRGGRCVRLTEGRFDMQTVFSDNPFEMAVRWQKEGGEYLHIVDLDGALEGESKNLPAIKEILANISIPAQLGGGIRTLKSIDSLLSIGLSRVILGSVAVRDPQLVKEAVKEYGEKIVVGIDAKDGQVAVDGWGVSGGIEAGELARRMADVGVGRIIFTDIARDGKLSGVNAEATADIAEKSGVKVIASGGVTSMDDIKILQKYAGKGIEGFIVGKAIYTGALNLPEAIKTAKEV